MVAAIALWGGRAGADSPGDPHDPPGLVEVGRASTGRDPKGVTLSPDGRTLCVTNFSNGLHDNVEFFDAQTLGRLWTVSFPGNAVESVWSRDGHTVYVSDFAHHRILFIDVASRAIAHEVPLHCMHPKVLVLSPDEATLYASCWDGYVVSVDTARAAYVDRAVVGSEPRGLALSPDGRQLYVAQHGSDELYLVDTATMHALRHVVMEEHTFPRHLALTRNGTRLFVSALGRGLLYEIDPSTLRVRRRAMVGACPKTILLSPDERLLFVANYCSNDVSVVDLATFRVRQFAPRGLLRASGLAVSHDGRRIWVTGWDSRHLVALDVVP